MLRVGTDLASVADVEHSLAQHGQAWLDRVFTPAEQERCAGVALRLAECFAVKEAALKVLQPERTDAVPWTDLELTPAGLVLHGLAGALAVRHGLSVMRTTVSGASGEVCAMVVAAAR